ncbi:MAG: 50S ribosomal protein L21 [Planctomycetota bacterium]
MFAIIRDGGKQYRVEEGMSLYLDRRDCSAGDKLELNEVLTIEDGSDFRTGAPLIDGAKVVAEVVGEAKGPKLIFHRFRRRKGSRSRSGHRQKYTQVRIESIHS